jgi:hypothetical protein
MHGQNKTALISYPQFIPILMLKTRVNSVDKLKNGLVIGFKWLKKYMILWINCNNSYFISKMDKMKQTIRWLSTLPLRIKIAN